MTIAERAQCAGKHPFKNANLAKGVAKMMRGKRVQAYRCPHCKFWHIGSRPKNSKESKSK